MDWLVREPKLGDVPYRPRVVISAGYSGSLQEHLKIGDVVLANEVVDVDGGRCPVTWPEELPAGEWRPPLIRGRVLTARRLIGDPAEKRALGNRLEALAVDMESAIIARACSRAGIPFGCVRAISDEAQTPISQELVSLLSSDRVSALRAMTAVLRSPGLAFQMWRLARATRLASLQLGKALGELLTLTLPWSGQLE
jgi:nucleoside phosphorylase